MKKRPRKERIVRKMAAVKKRGRPATGKRSNPAYRQALLWLKKSTVSKVVQRLTTAEKRFELSLLVQSLLEEWLKSGGRMPS